MTSVAVTTFEHAAQHAECYAARWGIEEFHRTLKSGCRIRDRQLGTADRLPACLGVDLVVAWRIYHLTKFGRRRPEHPCNVFFEEVEWKVLYCIHHKPRVAPDEPPSLGKAIRMLAPWAVTSGVKGMVHPVLKRSGVAYSGSTWRSKCTFCSTRCPHRAVGSLTPMAIGHHPRARDRLTKSSVYKDQPLAREGLGRGGAKTEPRHWLRQWVVF